MNIIQQKRLLNNNIIKITIFFGSLKVYYNI
jgi:hypothetical protein